jgi:sugar lactone lactonase YvrE
MLGARYSTALAIVLTSMAITPALGDEVKPVEVPGEQAFTESISAGPDGTLYLSSLASGGIARIKPGASIAESWIAPGAFDTRSTLGVFADGKSNTLWVCSNDMSGLGVAGPGSVAGSHLKAFDLTSGAGKASYPFPGKANLCNDMIVADDGSVLVTNSLTPQILKLAPGAKALEVFVEDKQFQPPKGAGLDGIAFGSDGNIYVNTFNGGEFFRVEVKEGKAGAVTKLATSRKLNLPDGLRHLTGQTFLMAEGSGTLDRVKIDGDKATIETVKDGFKEPTSVAKVGGTAWVAEGQLSHLFDAKENGPPKLPFQVVPVHIGD